MRYFSIFTLLAIVHLWLVPSWLVAGVTSADSDIGPVVSRVRVVGNERLDAETVESYAKVPLLGEAVSKSRLDDIIKSLYSTSLFSKVDVEVVGDELVISVVENPIVRDIIIHGNRAFNDKNLKEGILKLKKMSVFTEAKLDRDISALKALHHSRGLLGVKISHSISNASRNSVDITIKIAEGVTARIERIMLIGNESFTDDQLKAVMASKERRIRDVFGYFGDSTKFFTERLIMDRSLLRDFYTSKGFLDFKVKSVTSEVSSDLSKVTVIYALEEGKKYRFGDTSVEVDGKVFTKKEGYHDLSGMILTKKGEVFNMSEVNKTIALMTAYLHEKGNLFAAVNSEYSIQGDVVNVKYVATLGSRVYVRKINILGNTRTLDLVIRKKLGISEGDIYSAFDVRQSRKRLLNLEFFESVEADTYKVSDSLVDLNIKVKERGTGSFDVGAGFSPASGLVGKISIKEKNIFGTGKVAAFELSRSIGSISSMLDLVTNDIFESEISFGVGAFYNRQGGGGSTARSSFGGLVHDNNPFSNTNAGFSARLSCDLNDSTSLTLQYYYKYHSIHNIGELASVYIREQEGEFFDSSVGYSLVYSSLDNPYSPRRGVLARISQYVSGVGGNLHYVKTHASSAHVYPVFEKIFDDVRLKIKPSFGYVFAYAGEKVKIGQRFFVGSEEIRGFSSSGIGPRDVQTQESLGGKLYYALTLQLDFPIGLPEKVGIKGSLFCDVASLYGLDYENLKGYKTSNEPRVSVGFGFSWRSPFGPVRIDFGFPIVAKEFDIRDRIRISTDKGI